MTCLIVATVLYVAIYILLSSSAFQKIICERLSIELSDFLGGEVKIGSIDIRPFNEVIVNDLELFTPEGEKCLFVKKIGAGISLTRLILDKEIDISYAQVVGLDASVVQPEKGPLNIQFLIDAFAPKDKNKPPTKFNLKIRNITLRNCKISYDKGERNVEISKDRIDFNHLMMTNLCCDLSLPDLSDAGGDFFLKDMSFDLSGGLHVDKISLEGAFSKDLISLRDISIGIGKSRLYPSDIEFDNLSTVPIMDLIKREGISFNLEANPLYLSDFGALYPGLREFSERMALNFLVETNLTDLTLHNFKIDDNSGFNIEIDGSILGIEKPEKSAVRLNLLKLDLPSSISSRLLAIIPGLPEKVTSYQKMAGDIHIIARAESTSIDNDITGECNIISGLGNLNIEGYASGGLKNINVDMSCSLPDLGKIIELPEFGNVDLSLGFEGTLEPAAWEKSVGTLALDVERFKFRGLELGNLSFNLSKDASSIEGFLQARNDIGQILTEFSAGISEQIESLALNCDVIDLDLGFLGARGKLADSFLSVSLDADITGLSLDKFSGDIDIHDLILAFSENEPFELKELTLKAYEIEEGQRQIDLESDWFEAVIHGDFRINEIPLKMQEILAEVFPAFINAPTRECHQNPNLEMAMIINPDSRLLEYFNVPLKPLVPVEISAYLNGDKNSTGLSLNVPYIQQGRDKLICDTRLNLDLDGKERDFRFGFNSTLPSKKGDFDLGLYLSGENENISVDVKWESIDNKFFKGRLALDAEVQRDVLTSTPWVDVSICPTQFSLGNENWFIGPSHLSYKEKSLEINGFRVWHGDQFVEIGGKASSSPDDVLSVNLSGIDVDYVFDTLKINYVTFGGEATGLITGRGLFSNNPIAKTEKLIIKDLSYNGAVVGDGDISSYWDNRQKKVDIDAKIYGDGHQRVDGSGGVFLGADSLCFDIKADKVPVNFIQPFMKAFSSHVGGLASGEVRLAGNFHDIDLTGKIFADSVSVKLDYTQTYYHGSDSVYLNPGRIIIPGFRLYDKYGNSAVMSGELTHKYFHEPAFNFKLTEAENFLCYDTNSSYNPDWYGTVFGNGGATIRGVPGYVDIGIDMSLVGNSSFTFVLNETQAAADYGFLTFTDRRKAALEAQKDTIQDIKSQFRKKVSQQEAEKTSFDLDVRASINPSVLFTIVMDPKAGDKIAARGEGAMQIEYNSDDDKLVMFGRYIIDEGTYNFSLQDLILRDFKIREGSYITFNGDPLDADLDISAAYRVNTNLSDLDKSFSTDRDLNRTNVPVDAILRVEGQMTRPDISFDIDLPTLTQDVERKVRSIISTDDMMNRQIIYLLALNRFYTPEYMGGTGNGGELAAVASTTLSSQLSNILGQLTDKFTVSPSFRSDKGDFSDIEVDVALSSRLLNNRLLLNGNFGYRDKSTSTTTFIGDFDIEYLLSKGGNLRLKAYNHFNDQNYYLREALTTQGLGIIYRKDFDNLFFKKKKKDTKKEPSDEDKKFESEESSVEKTN